MLAQVDNEQQLQRQKVTSESNRILWRCPHSRQQRGTSSCWHILFDTHPELRCYEKFHASTVHYLDLSVSSTLNSTQYQISIDTYKRCKRIDYILPVKGLPNIISQMRHQNHIMDLD